MFELQWLLLFSAISVSAGSGCGFPGVPAHAIFTTTDDRFLEGTTVTYECDPGYQLLGRSMLRCVKYQWDAPGLPFCAREIAFSKTSGMSSQNQNVNHAVDDRFSTCAVTDSAMKHEWWVDLIETTGIQIVQVHFGIALEKVDITINLKDPQSNSTIPCYRGITSIPAATSEYFVCRVNDPGKNLTMSITSENSFKLSICEVKVYSQDVLSPQDSCGDGTRGKIESFKGKCYEVTPFSATFVESEKFCASQGSSPWSGDQTEFVSWMMKVHNLDRVWYQEPDLSPNRDAENCTLFSRNSVGWSRQNITCTDKIYGLCVRPTQSCGRPRVPKNLASWRSVYDKVSIGEVVSNFTCEEGYTLSGPRSYHCLKDGQFQEQLPTACYKSLCGQPTEVANAFPILRPETRYYCLNDSFTLYGSPDLRCNANTSQWETPHAICVRRSSNSNQGVRNFRDRLFQGALLFPVGTKVGLVSFLILVIALTLLAIVAVTNLVRYYRFIKPRLYQKHSSSVMLYSIHDELSRDDPPVLGFIEQNHNNLVVPVNQELDLSTGDAQVITRSTSSSTPNAPRTPNMRLNESSIIETKIN